MLTNKEIKTSDDVPSTDVWDEELQQVCLPGGQEEDGPVYVVSADQMVIRLLLVAVIGQFHKTMNTYATQCTLHFVHLRWVSAVLPPF